MLTDSLLEPLKTRRHMGMKNPMLRIRKIALGIGLVAAFVALAWIVMVAPIKGHILLLCPVPYNYIRGMKD